MRSWHWKRLAALGRQARLRRKQEGVDYAGPYYPHISDGLLVLESTDTGLRFAVTSGLWTVNSGDGSYLAYLPTSRRGRLDPDRFVLMAE